MVKQKPKHGVNPIPGLHSKHADVVRRIQGFIFRESSHPETRY